MQFESMGRLNYSDSLEEILKCFFFLLCACWGEGLLWVLPLFLSLVAFGIIFVDIIPACATEPTFFLLALVSSFELGRRELAFFFAVYSRSMIQFLIVY